MHYCILYSLGLTEKNGKDETVVLTFLFVFWHFKSLYVTLPSWEIWLLLKLMLCKKKMSLGHIAIFIKVIALFSEYLTLAELFPLFWIASVLQNNIKIGLKGQEYFRSMFHLLSQAMPGDHSRTLEKLLNAPYWKLVGNKACLVWGFCLSGVRLLLPELCRDLCLDDTNLYRRQNFLQTKREQPPPESPQTSKSLPSDIRSCFL